MCDDEFAGKYEPSGKVRKSVSLNKKNPRDMKVIERIEQDDIIFNLWAREAFYEKVEREERKKNAVIQRTEKRGIKHIMG